MFLIVILLSLWAFIKTISYGIYEIKQNNNKSGGFVVIIIAILALVIPNLAMWLN